MDFDCVYLPLFAASALVFASVLTGLVSASIGLSFLQAGIMAARTAPAATSSMTSS